MLGLDTCDQVLKPGSSSGSSGSGSSISGGARNGAGAFPFPTKEALARLIESAGGFPPVIIKKEEKKIVNVKLPTHRYNTCTFLFLYTASFSFPCC